MREITTGVWHWKAPHPEWNERQTWDRTVSPTHADPTDGAALERALSG
jgi:hypothetical protein